MQSLLITVLVGTIGGFVAKKLRFPAPFMIGSMTAVAVTSIMTGNMETTKVMKIFAQIVSGAYIGQNIKKEDLKNLPKLGKVIGILMGIFTINMVVIGLIFVTFFKMTPVTAFLCCLPGGIMDVSLMAIDMGAQSDIVATIQMARLMGILLILPLWISFWVKSAIGKPKKSDVFLETPQQTTNSLSPVKQWFNNILVLLVATIGGFIGLWLDIPVGALIIALIFSSALKMTVNTVQLTSGIRYIAQIFAGSIVGANFTHDSLRQIVNLIIPILILLVSYLMINAAFGFWMYQTGILDLQSALFASSPAGATDISLLAGDLGGDMPKIASIQISRTLYTVIIMPLLVNIIVDWL